METPLYCFSISPIICISGLQRKGMVALIQEAGWAKAQDSTIIVLGDPS